MKETKKHENSPFGNSHCILLGEAVGSLLGWEGAEYLAWRSDTQTVWIKGAFTMGQVCQLADHLKNHDHCGFLSRQNDS